MSNAISQGQSALVSLIDGKAVTTSKQVAELFGKRHERVLDAIKTLIGQLPPESQHNFVLTSVEVDQPNGGTRNTPAYQMTRDGFTLLAMGFTGKRALKFKLAYIDAFNQMEAALDKAIPAPPTRKTLPGGLTAEQQDAIKAMVRSRVEAMPKADQGKTAITCWSALKSKFGCGYKEISPEHFSEALSLVARLELGGDAIPDGAIRPRGEQPHEIYDELLKQAFWNGYRWLVTFDENHQLQTTPISSNACVIDPNKEVSLTTLIREYVPVELLSVVASTALERLSFLVGTKGVKRAA